MEAKIYVGTYRKYNEGSLYGAYLDLTNLSNKEEFYAACQVLHTDENDAEFMFQDFEGIVNDMPEVWIGESYISETVFEFVNFFKNDAEKAQHFLDWLKNSGYKGEFGYLKQNFENAFIGKFDSPIAYAEHLAEELGYYTALEKAGINVNYFDDEAFARDLFIDGYFFLNGVVYQSV